MVFGHHGTTYGQTHTYLSTGSYPNYVQERTSDTSTTSNAVLVGPGACEQLAWVAIETVAWRIKD